jgi:hypothetical protein
MEQVVGGIVTSVLQGWINSLEALNALLIGLFIAAPAVGAMMLVPAERRWPIVGRSIVASAALGAGLTLLATVGFTLMTRAINETYAPDYRWEFYFPYVAVLLAAIAIALQYRERRTFSRARAAGLLSAALTLIVVALFAIGIEKAT